MAVLRERARTLASLRFVSPFARPHVGWLTAGGGAALLMVLARLALPWPLARLARPWMGGGAAGGGSPWSEGLLPYAAAFVGLFAVLGIADLVSRYTFARFAVNTVRDMRMACLKRVDHERTDATGSLLTRLISDTARVKDGLKGFLVHVATNGLLFVGVSIALFALSPRAALVLLAAWILVSVVTLWAARRIDARALKIRRREGVLADDLHRAAKASRKQSRKALPLLARFGAPKATLTAMQGRAAFVVYVVLGIAIPLSAAATFGSTRPIDSEGELVFIAYTLMLIEPTVRLSRQGTRLGKMMPCLRLIEETARQDEGTGADRVARGLPPLHRGLRVVRARLPRAPGRSRAAPLSFELGRGERVAVVGGTASGKSALLAVLAGEAVAGARVAWDDLELGAFGWAARNARILWSAEGRVEDTLEGIRERVRARPLDLVLIDGALAGIPPVRVEQELDALFDAAGPAIVVVAMTRPIALERFGRVLAFERGTLVHDGPPARFRGPSVRAARDPVLLNVLRMRKRLLEGKLPAALAQGRPPARRVRVAATVYKPGRSARLAVTVVREKGPDGRAREVFEVDVRPDAKAVHRRFRSLRERNASRADGAVYEVVDRCAVVTAGSAIPYLRSLAGLFDPAGFREALKTVGLASLDHGKPPAPRLVSCEPRRWALLCWERVPGSDPPAALIAVHGPHADGVALANLRLLMETQDEAAGAFAVPRLIVHDEPRRAIFVRPPAGFAARRKSLKTAEERALGGRALADLHGRSIPSAAAIDHEWASRRARAVSRTLELAVPGLAPRLDLVAVELRRKAATLPAAAHETPVLRAVGRDELVLVGERAWFLRWDQLRRGDPMQDLGALIARVLGESLARKDGSDARREAAEQVVEGYIEGGGSVQLERLAWQLAHALLRYGERRIVGALPSRWEVRLERIVAATEAVLAGEILREGSPR